MMTLNQDMRSGRTNYLLRTAGYCGGPVHIEMVPYFNKDIAEAEEIIIRVASKIWNHQKRF